MSKVEVDRNLLFGLLAIQTGLVGQGALFAAFNAWTRDKTRSLAEILLEQGELDAGRRSILEGLLDVHLKVHDDAPEKSLAAIETGPSIREQLSRIRDSDLNASIALIGANHRPETAVADDSPPVVVPPSSVGIRFDRTEEHLAEQVRRWGQGERVPVEEFLEREPGLSNDSDALLDLIYNEVVLREHRGEAPAADEYVSRFPALGDEIRRQFDIHDMFSHEEAPSSAAVAGGASSFAVGTSSSRGSRFRVLRPHARGGLGAVFVALDTELHREVALKQIHDELADDPVSRRRFQIEAEIAGGLEHPGIVPVYGVGTYANGRPFYAMRFIRGESLKEAIAAFHSDEALKRDPGRRSLEQQKLLRRFLDVCNAIEYAHSRGVLHRDLKPSNIIVGKHGETLVVDWGLAKSVGRAQPDVVQEERTLVPSSGSGSSETLPGSALGTPAFMSPEQAHGDLEWLGPRSDVYSLGATLYALLTGRPPFQGDNVGAVLDAVWRGDFERPRKLNPSIAAPLEAICLKAMARIPLDRYASSRALADDIERWIADEPVSARPEPLSERARRWARQHRLSVTAAAASLLVALVASIAIAALSAMAARRERLLAGKEHDASSLAKARLEQVERGNELLASVFRDLDPRSEKREHKPLRAILGERLTQAAAALDGESVGDALTVAKLQEVLAQSQANLGNTAEAITLELRAYQTHHARLGPNNPRTLASRSSLFALYHAAGRAAEVIKQHEATLKTQQATLGPAHRDTLQSRGNLATAYLSFGRPSQAAAEFEAALKLSEQALGQEDPLTLNLRGGLAEAYRALDRPDEAATLHEQNLRVQQRRLGPDHIETLNGMENLAATHFDAGRLEQALALYEQSLNLYRSSLGRDHPDTLLSSQNLGVIFERVGRTQEAIDLLAETLSLMEAKLGSVHPSTLVCRSSLARAYRSAGRLDEAIRLFEVNARAEEATLGANHSGTLRTRSSLAATYLAAGRTADAIALFEPTLLALEANLGVDNGIAMPCRYNLAAAYRSAGRTDEAMALLQKDLKIMIPKLGPDDPETLWVRANIAETLRVTGHAVEAIPLFETVLAALEPKLRKDHPRIFEIRTNLAAARRTAKPEQPGKPHSKAPPADLPADLFAQPRP